MHKNDDMEIPPPGFAAPVEPPIAGPMDCQCGDSTRSGLHFLVETGQCCKLTDRMPPSVAPMIDVPPGTPWVLGGTHVQPMGTAMDINSVDKDKIVFEANRPAVWVEATSPNSATYEFREIPNRQAQRIILEVLPKALELYLQKSKDYGGNVMDRFGLGEKAAIPDMARKFGKLIDAIWRDQPLQFEQPDEILMDLLGHILIILDQRAERAKADDA